MASLPEKTNSKIQNFPKKTFRIKSDFENYIFWGQGIFSHEF